MKPNKRTAFCNKIFIVAYILMLIFLFGCNYKDVSDKSNTNRLDSILANELKLDSLSNDSVDFPKEKFIDGELMPEFPGGDEDLHEFIKKNMKYPDSAVKNKIEGVVYITFIVDKKGTLLHPKVLKGIGYGCDEEAIRLVKMMPKWNPGKEFGKLVDIQLNLPVEFNLF